MNENGNDVDDIIDSNDVDDIIDGNDVDDIIDGDDNQHHRSNITGPNALVSEMDQSRQN